MDNTVLKYAKEIDQELIRIRRTIHQNPELALKEFETAALVESYLKDLDLEVKSGVGKTGVVGLLKGNSPGKTLLIRADMDALMIEESSDIPYRSKNKNAMHACGHDAHVTWVLGAAKILSEHRDKLSGNVLFVFQPSEESAGGGADEMIEEGIMLNPKVDAAIAAHVSPDIPAGKIGIKSGAVTSTPAGFTIGVTGRGGHASEPWKCIDPIMVLNQIYMGLQNITRNVVSADHPSVLSVTKFHGGAVYNVIADHAEMSGTVRTFGIEESQDISEAMNKIVHSTASMYDAVSTFQYNISFNSVINDVKMVELLRKSASEVLGGSENVVQNPVFMGGDDFCFFSDQVPSVYFFVGVRNEELNCVYPLHSDHFNIDESCLHTTSAIIAQFALDYLK